jgi:hypothetical protein
MAGTHSPWARSVDEAATASASSPITIGTTGEAWYGRSKAANTRDTCPPNRDRSASPGSDRTMATAAKAAAASAGVVAVVKM